MMNEQDKKALQDALSKHGSTFDVVDFSVGFNEGLLAARGQQEPVGHILIDTGHFEHGTKDYHLDGNWEPVFTTPPAPVQQVPEIAQQQDDSLLLCASDLEHSAIYDNHSEMQDCIRAVALRIKAIVEAEAPAPVRLTDEEIEQAAYEATRRFIDVESARAVITAHEAKQRGGV